MDVKQAVQTAKNYVSNLYDEENIMNIGLEEVEFDSHSEEWRVTVGFSRPWDVAKSTHVPISDARRPRSYKLVCIDDKNGLIVSLKDRILVDRIPVRSD